VLRRQSHVKEYDATTAYDMTGGLRRLATSREMRDQAMLHTLSQTEGGN